MASHSYPSGFHDSTIIWAIVLSLGLHTLAVVFIPNIRWEEPKEPEVLQVELALPQKAPEPMVAPAVPEPEPVPEPPPPPPKEIPKPRIEPKPKPKPAPAPEPVAEPPPMPEEPQTAPPPPVITAPPEVETPTFTAPPPPPPEPIGPTQADLDAARSLYKSLLEQEIVKHKQYPKIAKMRGWQGEAVIELQIDDSGKPALIRVQTSSGYEALDKTAIEMVRKTVAATSLPEILRGNSSTFLVPVAFRLQN